MYILFIDYQFHIIQKIRNNKATYFTVRREHTEYIECNQRSMMPTVANSSQQCLTTILSKSVRRKYVKLKENVVALLPWVSLYIAYSYPTSSKHPELQCYSLDPYFNIALSYEQQWQKPQPSSAGLLSCNTYITPVDSVYLCPCNKSNKVANDKACIRRPQISVTPQSVDAIPTAQSQQYPHSKLRA